MSKEKPEGRTSAEAPDVLGGPGQSDTERALPIMSDRQVPADWTDYNGHMNEACYLIAAAEATDRFLDMLGAGQDYVRTGKSFFTIETHIRYLAEVLVADRIRITTQILRGEGKKLHLFHRLWRGDGTLSATVETLLVHVDLASRRSCQPDATIQRAMAQLAADHSNLRAEGAGSFIALVPQQQETAK